MRPRRFDHDECRRLFYDVGGWLKRDLQRHFGVSWSSVNEALFPEEARERRRAYYKREGHVRRVANRYGITFPEARKLMKECPACLVPNERPGERFLGLLYSKLGKPVRYEEARGAIYFDNPNGMPDAWKINLQGLVYFWRPKLMERGLILENIPRHGYRLYRIEDGADEYRAAA